MRKIASAMPLAAASAVILLTACQATAPLAIAPVPTEQRPAAVPVSGGFDWGWDITGDQPVRPIQVFSNGQKTWLQMAPFQVMPAVFVAGQPVSFDIAPPYLVLNGVPNRIDLIATAYRAVIIKKEMPAAPGANQPVVRAERPNEASRIQIIPSSQVPKVEKETR